MHPNGAGVRALRKLRGHFARGRPKGVARRAPVQLPERSQKNQKTHAGPKLTFRVTLRQYKTSEIGSFDESAADTLSTCPMQSRRTHVRCHQIRAHRAATAMVHSDHLCVINSLEMRSTTHFAAGAPTDHELPDLVLDMPGLFLFAKSNWQLDSRDQKRKGFCDHVPCGASLSCLFHVLCHC